MMSNLRKHLLGVLKTLVFFWIVAALAVAIGAERSNQLHGYLMRLIGVWDIVVLATVLSVIGQQIYQFLIGATKSKRH